MVTPLLAELDFTENFAENRIAALNHNIKPPADPAPYR